MVRYVQPKGCLASISETTSPIDKKFQDNIRTTKMCPAMQYCDVITNPRWRTAAILKIAKSPYLSGKSSDFDKIWYTTADNEPNDSHVTKKRILDGPIASGHTASYSIFLVHFQTTECISNAMIPPFFRYSQGRRHGFESGGGTILRAERAKKFLFDPPTFWPVGDKILLKPPSHQPRSHYVLQKLGGRSKNFLQRSMNAVETDKDVIT